MEKLLSKIWWTWGLSLLIGFFAWALMEHGALYETRCGELLTLGSYSYGERADIIREAIKNPHEHLPKYPFLITALVSYFLGAVFRDLWWNK